MSEISISRESLLYDISNMAYVVADTAEGTHTPHALHQTFDICSEGNVDRVDRVLALAFTECAAPLRRLCAMPPFTGDGLFRIPLKDGPAYDGLAQRARECVREYLTARVLHDWLTVTLPEAAGAWRDKAAAALSSLCSAAACLMPRGRRVPPI